MRLGWLFVLVGCGDNIGIGDAAIVACEVRAVAPATACVDTCSAGVCVDGACRATCELMAGVPTCDAATICVARPDLALDMGLGVCEPVCDPLTQCTRVSASPESCESIDPAIPDRGCVGISEFTCRHVISTAIDRELPIDGACAPGFVPLLDESTGSSTIVCAGLCAALEVDNTPAHTGNALGDPTAAAKLPGVATARIGDATCAAGKKGADANSTCRFLWPLIEARGAVPASFALRYLDTLGVCVAIAHYTYDADGDGTPDTPYPSCATLPPRSAATPGPYDDAYDWGCQKRSHGGTSVELRVTF
jgi:hypothetical protein